jgi:hypothetical protein
MVLAATCRAAQPRENGGGEEAGCPPVFLVRKAARKTLLL